jgi:hypothetical protein
MKKILLMVLAIGAILGVAYFINNKEVIPPINEPAPEVPVTVLPTPVNLCFYGENKTSNGLYDVAWLKLNILGDKVTGEFRNLPAEKDSKVGTFEGTVGAVDKVAMARTVDAWWDSMAEGMKVKEQLKIVFGEGNASAGFGEMVDRGDGVYVYKDATKLTYGMSMTDVACGDLAERALVEKYVRDNVSTIVAEKPVLGGTWYVMTIHLNVATRTGSMTYEDGHIQGKSNFSYAVDGDKISISLRK